MNLLNKLKQLLCKKEQQTKRPQPPVSTSILTGYTSLTPLFSLISPFLVGSDKQYFLADAVFHNHAIGEFTEPTLLVNDAEHNWLDLKFPNAIPYSVELELNKQLARWDAGARQHYNMKPPLYLKSVFTGRDTLAEVVTTILLAIRHSHSKTSQLAERIRKLTDEKISEVTEQPLQDQ